MKKHILLILLLLSCTGKEAEEQVLITVYPYSIYVKSQSPDPVLLTDFNILIYNTHGILEEKYFGPSEKFMTTMLMGCRYTVLVAANLGYELPEMSLEEAFSYRYPLAYPDEYTRGIPMAAVWRGKATPEISILLERLMARIDITLDSSFLDSDVSLTVNSIIIGNCPRFITPFSPYTAEGEEDFFNRGFSLGQSEVAPLNRESGNGLVSLYMFENLQGRAEPALRSYVEILSTYKADGIKTRSGEYLKYRFYPGRYEENFDVVRNTVYTYNILPQGKGLSGDSWRVDRSGLSE